jgi:hypothetical protein
MAPLAPTARAHRPAAAGAAPRGRPGVLQMVVARLVLAAAARVLDDRRR